MRFRKKPIEIEAIQITPNNRQELDEFLNENDHVNIFFFHDKIWRVYIDTLEGTMVAYPGDYIIRGIQNELYPCKEEIFKKTYEPI